MFRLLLYRLLLVMLLLSLVSVAPLAAQDAPAYSVRGPYAVGTMEFVLAPDSERPVPLTVWYPALNPDNLPEEIMYDTGLKTALPDIPDMMVMFPGSALAGAQPDAAGGPYPLVIYSHSNITSRFFTAYYQEHLASYGFVVMAPEHVGSAYLDGIVQPPDAIAPYALGIANRAFDVAATLDHAEVLTAPGGALENMIDLGQVAIAGWSLGGNTALVAAGARFDFDAMAAWCAEPGREEPCRILDHIEGLADLFGLDSVPEGLWPSFADPRVDALITMASGWTMAFSPEGYAHISMPSLTMMGTGDDPFLTAREPYTEISSGQKALVEFEGAGHTIYGNCPPAFVEGGFPFCFDPEWEMDRAHDLIKHLSVAFLLDVLKGDTEAHAALASDAVVFPGIAYEEVGF